MKTYIVILLMPLLLSELKCSSNQVEESIETPRSKPVARVYDKYLYQEDLEGLIPSRASIEDSADIVNRYVDTWIRKQLLLTKAEQNLSLNEAEIERRVQDYKYQLIVYDYEKRFIEENLDTLVTEKEIEEYYQENTENFELKQNIVQGIYLKIPKEAPRIKKVKGWLFSEKEKDQEELRTYAYSYANKYVLNDSLWIDFDDVIANTPFVEEITNKVQVLENKKFLEAEDEEFLYYFKITDYRISENEYAPLEMVSEQVKNIIINKRKIELRNSHQNSIFENAERENNFEIYK